MKLLILGFISAALFVGLMLVNMQQNPGKYAQTIEEQSSEGQEIQIELTPEVHIDQVIEQNQEPEKIDVSPSSSPELVSESITPVLTQDSQNVTPEPSATPIISMIVDATVIPTAMVSDQPIEVALTESNNVCRGDVTADGSVDLRDLNMLIEKFNTQDCSINQDNDASCLINIKDYSAVIENYSCKN